MKNYINVLAVISAFAVVGLHTNVCFWFFSYKPYWVSANVIESVLYFAVPVFFMISGATLLDYPQRYSTCIFFKKRFYKTVIPFLFWCFIYGAYDYPNHPSSKLYIPFVIIPEFNFFISLFGVYLVMPLLAAVQETKKMTIYTYLSIVILLGNLIFNFLLDTDEINAFFRNFIFMVGNPYVFYVLTGYIFSRYILSRKVLCWMGVFAIVGLLVHLIATYFLSLAAGKIVSTYKGYFNIPCVLYSLGVFVFIKQGVALWKSNGYLARAFSKLKSYTFAIYVLHMLVIKTILAWFPLMPTTSLTYRLLMPFVIIVICIGVTSVLRCTRWGKYILPC